MKIITTTDLSRDDGNCYVHETISLAEQFDMFFIIRCVKILGGNSIDPKAAFAEVVFYNEDCGLVMERFYALGGKI